MKIGIATDHGGYELKEIIQQHLIDLGHEVKDFGAYSIDKNDDYPDFVIPLANAVSVKEVNRGIAVCGSGVGASVAANKVIGVRAALINEHYSAHQGVEHDDLNVLCLGGRVIGTVTALELVDAFINASFTAEERHLRRLNKVKEVEEKNIKS